MDKYVALLRGINVGGHQVPMAKLKKTFEEQGCENVQTILVSGNVVFEAKKENLFIFTKKLEIALAKAFGFSIPVLLRTGHDIEKLIASVPFKGITVTPETRLYVTFFLEKQANTQLPRMPGKDIQILKVTDTEVYSVLRLSPNVGTIDLMSFLEKEFSKNITTRNWNTLIKIAKVFGFPLVGFVK
jgi:uncharacterized protein (DUF1697 family)